MGRIDFSRPCVMGILNITPDSFSSAGRFQEPEAALQHAKKMIAEGAAIIDIGGEPTNPNLEPCLSLQQELDRVLPVLELLCQELPVPISIDTSKPEVIKAALELGVSMINDVRALRRDGAVQAVTHANNEAMVCLMHMSFPEGKAQTILHDEFEPDVISVVKTFLLERINSCLAAGIQRERLIIDPGIGFGSFGKSTQQNLILLNQLNQFRDFNLPILIGVSRKTFIGDILKVSEEERVAGSLATAAIAVYNGATIIRTHDVKATVDVVRVAAAMKDARGEVQWQ